jgi:malonate transporter and related proteins
MNPVVWNALVPVVLLIAIGYIAVYARLMRAEAVKDLSTLTFSVLTPALLFRTMSTVHLERLDFKPVLAYFAGAILMFAAMLVWSGVSRRSAVVALSTSYGNTVAIGIPLIGLAYGEAALVPLFTLISMNALIMLTLATIALEFAVTREAQVQAKLQQGAELRHPVRTVLVAMRNGIVHPVPLPIIAGLLFAQTGLVVPEVLDRPLQLLANAMGPLALMLVGVTLAASRVGALLRGALVLTGLKNVVLPLLVAGLGWLMGLRGLSLTVMVVAASMPIGANVFMFSQRYNVAEELVTASVAVSTAMALVTVSLVMALVTYF